MCELDSSGNILAVDIFGANGLLARHNPANGHRATDAFAFDIQGNVAGGLDNAPNTFDGYGKDCTGNGGADMCWG